MHVTPTITDPEPYKRYLTYDEFEILKNIFFYEIKSLEKLLNWDCNDWFVYK